MWSSLTLTFKDGEEIEMEHLVLRRLLVKIHLKIHSGENSGKLKTQYEAIFDLKLEKR